MILLTDPPPLPKDERCPTCGAGREKRKLSETYGPLHDVCSVCRHNFQERTVFEPEQDAMSM